jgi:sulfhydrogenase subunit beta (sulfur reductase)
MNQTCLKKDRLGSFIEALCAQYRVVAPIAKDGKVAFQAVTPEDTLALDFPLTKKPPKEFVFPQCEKLMVFKEGRLSQPAGPAEKTVILGIRPCDCRSFLVLDQVFRNSQFTDPYYSSRRANTLLVAIGCNQPASTCFCTSVGGGPFDPQGADILLLDAGEAYVVRYVSERGKVLLDFFSDPAQPGQNADDVVQAALAQLPPRLDPLELAQRLKGMAADDFWQQASEKCLGCGACAYLCPTCHCFDISDETSGEKQVRYRTWDTCSFPLFTLEASGFNPRPQKAQRFRQRILHKFDYFPNTHGVAACVGCGRCVRECPVNLDIRTTLADIRVREVAGK